MTKTTGAGLRADRLVGTCLGADEQPQPLPPDSGACEEARDQVESANAKA